MDSSKETTIGASPLLQQDAKPKGDIRANSTVHPDKLDQKRFTERRAEKTDGNAMRILIYFVIVVVLGAGAAFLIRTLISENETSDDSQDEVVSLPTNTISSYDINKTELSDALATNAPVLEDLDTSTLVSIGTGSVAQKLTEVEYRNYTTFDRLTFKLETSVPATEITLNTSKDLMTIAFPSTISVADDLQNGVTVLTMLDSVEFDTTFNQFSLNFSEAVLYRARIDGTNLVVDFSTEDEIAPAVAEEEQPEDTPATQPEEELPAEDEDNKPAGTNYENDFSQNKQYVTSSVTDNTISQNNYYFYDEGSYFEFSFGAKNKVGDDYVTNSSVELKTENGKNYLYWTVENLSGEALAAYSKSEVTATDLSAYISTTSINFVKIERLSFENGTAKYKIELKNKADFSLVTQKSYDNSTQLISILIKD